MIKGFSKSYRKELDSDIWKMPPLYQRVFFWLRLKAKYKVELFPTRKPMGIWLRPGQYITSIDYIAKGVSWLEWGKEKVPNKKTIKDILVWLESNGMIAVESNAYGTFVNVVNWGIYHPSPFEKVTINDPDLVTENKRLVDTIKELKKESKKEKKEIKTVGSKRFSPPSIEEVKAYCLERKNIVDPETWMNHYQSKGWMIGKNKMKDWKAAVRTWESKGDDNGRGRQTHGSNVRETSTDRAAATLKRLYESQGDGSGTN